MINNFDELDTIAVLDDRKILIGPSDRTHKITIYHMLTDFESILDFCRQLDIYNVWIAPYTDLSGKFTKTYIDTISDNYGTKGTVLSSTEEGYVRFTKGYVRDGKDDIIISIPENNYLWELGNYDDISTEELLGMLLVLRHYIPVSIINSPSKIGLLLLNELTSNNQQSWLGHTNFVLNDIPLATSLVWRKDTVQNKKYLHAYDKNGAFLSSYYSNMFGTGNVTHYENIAFDDKKVGVWRVEITGNSIYNGTDLPLPYNKYATNMWLWTPELKAAKKLGYKVVVKECFIWEEKHYVFRKWAKFLWDLKEELNKKKDKNLPFRLAYDGAKKIYTHMGGRLAYRVDDNTKEDTDMFHRYDWYSMVVAYTKLIVLLQIDNLVKLGYYPIMVETDCIYYLSDERNGDIAIPTILDNKDSLGGYKRKYSIEWDRVRELFESGVHPNMIAKELNRLEREGLTW